MTRSRFKAANVQKVGAFASTRMLVILRTLLAATGFPGMGPPPVIPFAFTRTLVILNTRVAAFASARTPSVATTATTKPKDFCVPVDIVVLLPFPTEATIAPFCR